MWCTKTLCELLHAVSISLGDIRSFVSQRRIHTCESLQALTYTFFQSTRINLKTLTLSQPRFTRFSSQTFFITVNSENNDTSDSLVKEIHDQKHRLLGELKWEALKCAVVDWIWDVGLA
jgi:hypothetical protein